MSVPSFIYFFPLFYTVLTSPIIIRKCSPRECNNPSVKLLQDYIRIDTSKEKNIGKFCFYNSNRINKKWSRISTIETLKHCYFIENESKDLFRQ